MKFEIKSLYENLVQVLGIFNIKMNPDLTKS